MAQFTTRVLLHKADETTEDEYDILHQAMEQRGFSRTITSSDGTEYHLPHAEYNFEGAKTRGEVLDLAKAAARTTGLKSAILVTESSGRKWIGLDKVED